jgi:CrcB protein
MARFLWICFGGALGTGVRYLVGLWAGKALGTTFPYGTLIVNVLGCFLIAAITHIALTTTSISPTLRLTLTTGVMGGLTTYSSFNLETTNLLRERAWASATLNVGATAAICFVAGLLGLVVARRFVGG